MKEWYYKSEHPSCPMCRGVMYFRGMYKHAQEWEEEKQEELNQEVFAETIDLLCDEDVMIEELIEIEEKYKKLMSFGNVWDPEVLFDILNDPFCEPVTEHVIKWIEDTKNMESRAIPYRKLTPREAKRRRVYFNECLL